MALFLWAATEALAWPTTVARLPFTVTIPATIISGIILARDCRDMRAGASEAGGWWVSINRTVERAMLPRTGAFFGYLLCLLGAAYLIGQMIALPLFIMVYLLRWGGYGWRISIGYAIVGWLVLYGFYDQIMHVLWHQPLLLG